MSRRYRALRRMGVDRLSAFIIAQLNDVLNGPAVGPICIVKFLHMQIDIDDGEF